MQTQLDYLEDIKKLMEKSSRFLSLSGLSGIFAGFYALIGAAAAWWMLDFGKITYDEYFHVFDSSVSSNVILFLVIDAIIVLILAVSTAWYFSWKKAGKAGQRFFDGAAKRALIQLAIPLVTGGIFTLVLIFHHNISLVAGATLVFYGLALVNAGKFTHKEIVYLGITDIAIGLLAMIFINFGLLFWSLGFGVMHIVYGSIMYVKYDK